uniref:A-type ATP synthase subunit I n=1 Tax=uncultured marine thaumarchaeote KM3_65_D04 TaxID=1456224 RepID=A0A075HHQ0_9ARCH|nr:V-type ATP synthase subunit I (ATPVI, ntpI) [uncultured marine thaumarchaeote KM3_65_D04]
MFKPVKMAKIAIMGLRKNQQNVVSILHDMEVLQLEPLSKDVLAIVKNERDNELTRQVTDQLLRVKALMTALPSIPVTVRKRFDSIDDLLQTASTIDVDEQVASLEKEKEALLTEIKDTENNLKLVEEFSFFPEDLKILQLSSANSYFGRIPSDKFEEFKKTLDAYKQDIMLYTKADKKVTHLILVVFPTIPSDTFAEIIQKHNAKIEAVPNLNGTPNEIITNQKSNLQTKNQRLKQINDELNKISEKHFANLVEVEEQLQIENKKLEVISNLGVTKDAFAMEGWVPKSKLGQIESTLKKFAEGTIIYELETKDKPPTLMSNPRRFRLFEAFIRFYSLPQSKEFDPTMVFALVFPVFYGLMIGDTGYCLVILLVCLWVIRRVEKGKRNLNIMPRQLRSFAMLILKKRQMVKLSKAMIPGCVVGIVLGVIFDLHFGFHLNGYVFDVLASAGVTGLPEPGEILNRPSQAFLDPIHNAGTLLLYAGYIGIGFVSFGLILGIMNCIREGEKKEALVKVGWLAFGWGVVLLGLALISGDAINPMWPKLIEVNPIAFLYFGLIFSGIGLMVSCDKGAGAMKVMAIMELATIVSHILSYTRLIGILLASVILAHTIDYVFLKALHIGLPLIVLGTMILFIGHLFNIIIGVFEPGIQGARLIYVEYFSKFYRGNGRAFKPFGSLRKFTEEKYHPEQQEEKKLGKPKLKVK